MVDVVNGDRVNDKKTLFLVGQRPREEELSRESTGNSGRSEAISAASSSSDLVLFKSSSRRYWSSEDLGDVQQRTVQVSKPVQRRKTLNFKRRLVSVEFIQV